MKSRGFRCCIKFAALCQTETSLEVARAGSPTSFAFWILAIHFSSCGNPLFHLTLHFRSRYLNHHKDVHSRTANLAPYAPSQGDSCPLNCAIFWLSPTKNSKNTI